MSPKGFLNAMLFLHPGVASTHSSNWFGLVNILLTPIAYKKSDVHSLGNVEKSSRGLKMMGVHN